MQCRDEELFQRLSARAQDIVKDDWAGRGCSWGGNMEETQTRQINWGYNWDFYGNSMGILWPYGNSKGILPSGNLLHSYGKWPFIVYFLITNGDFP